MRTVVDGIEQSWKLRTQGKFGGRVQINVLVYVFVHSFFIL